MIRNLNEPRALRRIPYRTGLDKPTLDRETAAILDRVFAVEYLFGDGVAAGGAKAMEMQPLEVYAADSNYAVVKPPGRQFPGTVVQGDGLRHLCGLAVGVARWFRDHGPTDDPEVLGDVQELAELLVGRLLHYQRVLAAHGIGLPYPVPLTEADVVRLLPDAPDAEPGTAADGGGM